MVSSHDLSTRSACADAVEAVAAHYSGALDVLVNNAGVLVGESLADLTEERFDHCMDVNCKSALWVTQAAVKYLEKYGFGMGKLKCIRVIFNK
jgi:NAD(P)-dependent dehydrogenase (short-subunit alcohol dehydrogenase family)